MLSHSPDCKNIFLGGWITSFAWCEWAIGPLYGSEEEPFHHTKVGPFFGWLAVLGGRIAQTYLMAKVPQQ